MGKTLLMWRDGTVASLFWILIAHTLNQLLNGFVELLIPLTLCTWLVGIQLSVWCSVQIYSSVSLPKVI